MKTLSELKGSDVIFIPQLFFISLISIGFFLIMIKIDLSLLEKLLFQVEKPGRYVGGEHNQVTKYWDDVETHVALCFPDIYDIGQSNLGLAILYNLLNRNSKILAERVYAPWLDMELLLREHSIPLFTLESKTPLECFDILGFSLPYEQIYTNVINILDLSRIPIHSRDRTDRHPLVIAGGQACFNPEPMADFIDAFAIGEGEEVILEIVDVYQAWKRSLQPRSELLHKLAVLKGVYVPSLVEIHYSSDGKIADVQPKSQNISLPIQKRIVPNLTNPVTDFLVPNISTVHDRLAIEIMRGCTRGCRFCHAGMVNRPVREYDATAIITAIKQGLLSTGYENISLLSLSSSDHTQILEMVQKIYRDFHDARVSVNLPSLRIASFSLDLMQELRELKPSGGFTLAPEAATDRLRAIINKPLAENDFLDTIRAVFERGWLNLKLYFMIGLPQETMGDVREILNLSRKIQQIGKSIRGNRTRIHLGIATFIPKPHTPFQWYPIENQKTLEEKLDLLMDSSKKSGIKMTFNPPEMTLLESWLSRGDRKLGNVIFQAWKNGAKFDAWSEKLNLQLWKDAFTACGIDPDSYSSRERTLDEILPWDHISTGVTKKYLLRELQLSQSGRITEDCRTNCYYCGILDGFQDLVPPAHISYWGCPQNE